MKRTNWKNVAEFLGLVSIVVSLLLVAYELRQSTALATAQAVFDLNTVLDDSYRRRSENAVLDNLVKKGHDSPATLSASEKSQFDAWLRADMNVTESVWFYYSNGILSTDDMDGFQASICSRLSTEGGRQYWARESKYFSVGFQEAVTNWCF